MKKQITKEMISLILALIMTLAINYNPAHNLEFSLTFLISWLIIFILINILLRKKLEFKVWPFINACIFAIFIIVGKCFDNIGTILFIDSFKEVLEILIYFSGLTTGFYLILKELYEIIAKYKPKSSKLKNNKVIKFIVEEHPFLMGMLITLIVSSFYLIFFYPGTFTFDGKWQLNAYFGYWERNDHHPFLLSTLMARLLLLGRMLLNDNLGIFFYILIQMIINALVYGYMMKIMKELKTPFIFRIIILIFYAFFPLWAINSITYIKDTIYYLTFLLIVVYQYYHFEVKKNMDIKNFIFLSILYFILFIWRNTGFYIGIISVAFLILIHIKNKRYVISLASIMISIFLLNTWYHKVYLPTNKVDPALPREKMSIFLQQTARYLKVYPEDITRNEKENLETLFKVDIETLASVYDPNRSDNVKERIHNYPTNEQLSAYFKAWLSMFKKHPLVYVDATLNNTYGYFYSQNRNFMNEPIGFYSNVDYGGYDDYENYNIYLPTWSKKPRKLLQQFAQSFCDNSLTGLLYSPFFYTWILIILSLYHISKKNFRFLGYFIPLYLTLALCIISPVNGHMRYLQPIAVSLPMIIVFTINPQQKKS